MRRKELAGVRVAVLAADGFEQVEVTIPVKALRKAGADVRVVSLRPGRIRGLNFMWRGKKIPVDDTVFTADPAEYSALLLPGGFINPDLLRQSEKAKQFVQAFDRVGKPIATLCHGPEVLISAGLVNGRRLASWPGIADDVRNAGGTWVDQRVVRDANWVSSRSPMDLGAFNPAMVSLFSELAPPSLVPAPRRVRWVASLIRLGSLAALGAAAYGIRRRLVAARA
jgi:protease I